MKKNLLTLSFLAASAIAFAQDTYIGNKAVVKVQPNTLFYHGGNVTVAESTTTGTPISQIVKNEGNFRIEGDYTNTIDSPTGAEFVNVWTDANSYGQLIINANTDTNGKVALERSTPQVDAIDDYIIALPFKSTAEEVFSALTNFQYTGTAVSNPFSGDCALNVRCNTRYSQSMFVWDHEETEYDPVSAGDAITPWKRYLINTRAGSAFNDAVNAYGLSKVAFAGIPSNEAININLKSGLKGNSAAYDGQTYGQWKNQLNNYQETYNSYIGNQLAASTVDGNYLFGKNLHRLANPYTSNLDLSDVNTGSSWINFNMTAGLTAPTSAHATGIRFRVFKLANDFSITWNPNTGNTSTGDSNTSFSAFLLNGGGLYTWSGSPEALLIKPYETFYIDYYTLNRTANGNSRLVDAQITLGDDQKTFDKAFASSADAGIFSRGNSNFTSNNVSALLSDEKLKARGLVTDFDFTQMELYLSENSKLKGNAAYLLNANFLATGNDTSNKVANNPIFFYEETAEGDVVLNAETISNYFNSEDYIGKPLRLGFKNLIAGNEYQVNVNLYEYSILNKVSNLSLGRYYLLDKLTNTVSEVDGLTQINFRADENSNDRFEFYWNESPRTTLATEDLLANTTYVFKNNAAQYVRFENNNTTADIEIYDVTGRSIQKNKNVSTASDYKLNLSNVPNVYVVVITYKDGKVVTKKTINK